MLPTKLYTRTRRTSSDDSLIAMINIVFLLLVFFMVTGQVKASGNPAVQLPFSSMGTPAQEHAYKIEMDNSGQLTLNGEATALAQLDSTLAEVDGATVRIALLADKHLTARELDEVLSVIRAHNIAKVTLFSDGQEAQ